MDVSISSENVIWAIFQGSPTEKDKVEKTAQYFKRMNKLKQPFYQAPSNDNGEKDSMTSPKLRLVGVFEAEAAKLRVKYFKENSIEVTSAIFSISKENNNVQL